MTKPAASATPAPRLSREQSQIQTREGLLATAARLFVEKGYGGTSLRDIADQAGYSQGAFYSNFESKEALLLEMLRRHMQREAEQLAALTEQHLPDLEAVLHALQEWATMLDQDVNWSMLSIELQLHAQRSQTFAAAYQTIWQTHQQALADWLKKLFSQAKATPAITTEHMASAFMALAHGLALQKAATGQAAPTHTLVVLLRGLLKLSPPQT